MPLKSKEKVFTGYQIFVIAVLSFMQFAVILDFMVISPLGVILMKTLSITPSKFSLAVSAYAFSAGASGLLAAGFADKFDRKRLLLFFFSGFLLGTVLCAIAPTFELLLVARIVTGIFGGVIGSVSFAIITDLFPMQVRGRVMGYVQMSFSASQVLGIPVGLWLANAYGWHACFWMIAAIGTVAGIVIAIKMRPVREHLTLNIDRNALHHLVATLSKPRYLFGFLTMSTLASGFMLMPFGTAFATQNLGLTMDQLPLLFLITGLSTIVVGPIAGKISDAIGKNRLFIFATLANLIVVAIYTNMGTTPFWIACAISVAIWVTSTARMIPAGALVTAIPEKEDRGAYMSLNSAIMQISGGISTVIAGLVVTQSPAGKLVHYDLLGYLVAAIMLVSVALMYFINRSIEEKSHAVPLPDVSEQTSPEFATEAS
ncbi:MAG: MFS transporter [Bacteroidota bacterium]|nr:MFS transporter [Bacteroidota bacterium]MDP4234281.1 MFS transporter [Bacteroidota bacterium]MDP4243216.1 MFS transporter [Bacteroidota bacterium]MDP4288078.1 MFS transporter [Bacteroidota bacterium]